MKRILLCAAAIALAASTAFASGVAAKGPIVEKEIAIGSFDTVDVSGIGSVRWTASATPKLVVRTNESLFEYLDCSTSGGRLKLSFKPGVVVSGLRVLEFSLASPAFRNLNLSGSSDFKARSRWEAKDIEIDVSGSGAVEAELRAKRARSRLSGSGSVKLAGDVDELALDLSGSGSVLIREIEANLIELTMSGGGEAMLSGDTEKLNMDLSGSASVAAKELETEKASVTMTGAGTVEMTVKESLDANVSGSGSIRYWGNPAVSARTSGSAKILAGN